MCFVTRSRTRKAAATRSFEGWVRNHNEGHRVHRLEYEAFEALAVKEGERIVAEAIKRFGTSARRVFIALAVLRLATWLCG